VRGVTPGSRTNQVSLTRGDTNPSNNNATFTVTVLGTCGNPFGNGTNVTCPAGNAFNSSLANTTIPAGVVAATFCCVSVLAALAGVCLIWPLLTLCVDL
jgi:hypothetical protein